MRSGQGCFNPVILCTVCALPLPPYCNISVLWLGQNNQYVLHFSPMRVLWNESLWYLSCRICQNTFSSGAVKCKPTLSNWHWSDKLWKIRWSFPTYWVSIQPFLVLLYLRGNIIVNQKISFTVSFPSATICRAMVWS